jgi:hypothetical protein
MRTTSHLAPVLAVLAVLALPLHGAAQTPLAAAEATAFLGAWTLGVETPQGALSMDLTLKDEGGNVAAAISAPPMMPEPQAITDISKDGDGLALKYMLEVQGMQIPAKIVLKPDGDDKWKVNFDFAEGQFSIDGTAAKK